MVTQEKDVIGFKELFSIIVIIVGTKASDMTSTLLFEHSLNAAWMVVIFSFLIILPSLLVLNQLLEKYKSKNLFEITQLLLGRKIAFVIGLAFLLYAVTKTAIDTRSYSDQLITINLPKTPMFILYILLLVVCLWGAKRGWETIGSVAFMVVPYILLALSLLYLLLFKEIQINRMFPLFGLGYPELAKASFKFTSVFSDIFLLAIMYPFVKKHKTYAKGIVSSAIFTVILMSLLLLLYALIFDYRSLDKITYPFNEAIRFVSIGKAITNIETFFITFWLLAVFVKFTVYIYITSKIFGFVFHIEEFEHTLLPITILILILGMIPENDILNIFFIKSDIVYQFKYIFLTLPFILWIFSKFKGVKTNESS
ncbi:GerAB/ArcD/ProY family transporter [Metabacillus malikii]|nr:endospore germination permease [Metabacillus malikii]